METILNADQISAKLDELAEQILGDLPQGADWAIIGMRERGGIIAERIAERLEKKTGREVDCGSLDFTLFRDDLNMRDRDCQPVVRATEVPFDSNGRIIILVDDVIKTGRSVRAALDALIGLGRPTAVRLAVLLDGGCRELPIRADYVGQRVDVKGKNKRIKVQFMEINNIDQVIVE